jgi:AraC-like DNA-binding protein
MMTAAAQLGGCQRRQFITEELVSTLPASASQALSLFAPPYNLVVPCGSEVVQELRDVDDWKGCALVWQLTGSSGEAEYAVVRQKARGLPLLVLLPPPVEVHRILGLLPLIRLLSPRLVLPFGVLDTPYRLRQALAMPPRGISGAVTNHVVQRGLLRTKKEIREFQRIMDLAPDTHSITALSKRMYTSRRTLGRHFNTSPLPVPSHCLQFGRLLHVALQLHNDDAAMFRIAARFGYPDGFTMSNQMKRLIGYRPSEVRDLLGWEWIVESWLKQEGLD